MLIRLYESQGAYMLQVTCVSLIGGEKLSLHGFTSAQWLDILGASHDTHGKARGSLMYVATCNIEVERGGTLFHTKGCCSSP